MPNNSDPAAMCSIVLIGMDDRRTPFFDPAALRQIGRSSIFSGGKRHHDIVAPLLPPGARWIDITIPLSDVFQRYREALGQSEEPLVVFASGDPLFFGLGNTLRREMPDVPLTLYPSFNSLQMLAHRLILRYDDMRTVSLTGRPWQELDVALIERAPKIGVLTDRTHTPSAIASRLLEYGYTAYRMHVGEHLGNESRERVRTFSLPEAAATTFEHPNNLILVASEPLPPRPYGIPDDAFALLDGRTKMITKAPLRLLTLQALELPRRRVFWDVGFCTGSVSIEARLQFPHLTVVAFEIRPEGRELMDANTHRHGAPGITTRIGDFLQADIDTLPRPDAVFIGGHGGRLPAMIERIATVLQPGGCIVLNSVSSASREAFLAGSEAAGLTLSPSLHVALNDYNPIEILKASKPVTEP